jgi:hypothetical protein
MSNPSQSNAPHIPKPTHSVHGLAEIMRLAFTGNNLAQLTSTLAERIRTNALDAAAMLDLSIVLQLNGKPELAMELQAQALQLTQVYSLASNPVHPRLRMLAIMGPGEVMCNTPVEFLIEKSDIALQLLYLGEGVPATLDIPKHDVAFVAPCEFDRNQALLKHLSAVMRYWPRPFINLPSSIAGLTRNGVARALRDVNNVVASDASRVTYDDVYDLVRQFPDYFPFIIRPVNSHAGHGLEKVEDLAQLAHYFDTEVHDEYFVAPFFDYRSEDGWYRKYRIVVIEGRPFAAHMAISQHWMVHYLNADMLNNAKNREEEAQFMQAFETDFTVKHRMALEAIDRRMQLDYYAIDCAETRSGELLVFEIDSGAVVHAMDPVDIFPYKAPQMTKVFSAFQAMLYTRGRQGKLRAA